MSDTLRDLVLALTELYYPARNVRGELPSGPCIVVANHPNGLLDPLLLQLACGRPVAFLAKHTLFGQPALVPFLRAFGAIPVYRASEGDTARNVATFARAHEVLAAGGVLALFPEGISHDAPDLQPLRTGAARIALSGPGDVPIVPVGLTYADKGTFRSSVTVCVGPAIDVERWRTHGLAHDNVEALTDAIADALREQVLEADDRALWNGFRTVAAWTTAPGATPLEAHDRARDLATAWRRVDPFTRDALADEARALATRLGELGIDDPLLLERTPKDGRGLLRLWAPMLLLALPAAFGALLGWPPYRLTRTLARELAPTDDVLATWKLLVGMVLIPTWWSFIVVMATVFADAGVALTLAVLAPTCGLAALVFDEKFERRRALGRAWWTVTTQETWADEVCEQRRRLSARIEVEIAASMGAKGDVRHGGR